MKKISSLLMILGIIGLSSLSSVATVLILRAIENLPRGPPPDPSSESLITSFVFRASDNFGISADIPATINGTAINATVPHGTGGLIPTITISAGATINPGSGVMKDFSTPINYTVTAEDDSTTIYTVTVTVALSSEKDITSFYFLKWANPGLPSSIVASINGDVITALLPEGANISALIASFTTTGVSVEVDGVEQVSDITANDYNWNPRTYEVFAEDGSSKLYAVAVVYRKEIGIPTSLVIPDGNLGGVTSVITFPDIGVCTNLLIFVNISNPDIGELTITLETGLPFMYTYTLHDGGLSGPTLITTYPSPSLPVLGDLWGDWLGQNPCGSWTLKCVDAVWSGGVDGWLHNWSVIVDLLF